MLFLATSAAPDLRPLRAHTTGDVVVPGERVWNAALEGWDLDEGREPAAVVFPADEFDVAAVRSYARAAGLRIVVAGTEEAERLTGDLGETVLVERPATRPPWSWAA